MTSKSVTVVNQLGMHARAAAKFVHLATRFQSHVRVAREARAMDGKSIMGILLLAAACGSTITITAEGDDEDAALESRAELVHSGLGRVTAWCLVGRRGRSRARCHPAHADPVPIVPTAARELPALNARASGRTSSSSRSADAFQR
jgi:phosphocarrier protein